MMIWDKITAFTGAALLACGSLLLGGCGESESYAVSEGYEAGTTETSTAKLEISGMMCAHACGGKIKKELLEIPGVANASIDFESGRDLNAAEVEFDPETVTPESLAEVVNGIADGKLYAVASVQVTHFAKEATLSQ
jgi:copper chaperone CopZ